MKNILNPHFIQKIDHYLLTRYPNFWISKIHYVLYYSLISTIISTIIGSIYPISIQNFPSVNTVYAYLFIPVTVVTILWVVKQLHYNLNHNHTKSGPLEELKRALISTLVLGIIFSQLYILPTVLNQREKTFLSAQTEKIIIEGLHYFNLRKDNYQIITNPKTQKHHIYLSYNFNLGSDPIKEKNHAEVDNYSKKLVKTRAEIYKEINTFIEWYNKSYVGIDQINDTTEEIIERLFDIEKREEYDRKKYDYYYTSEINGELRQMVREINKARYYTHFPYDEAVYLLSFIFAILITFVSIFKQVFWKQFLIMIGVLALSPLVIGILAVTFFGLLDIKDDWGYFPPILVYVFFIFQILLFFRRKEFSGYLVVITMLIHVTLPFVPIYLFETIKDGLNIDLYDYWYYQSIDEIFLYLGYLLVFLAIPLFQPIYSRLYVLPKKK